MINDKKSSRISEVADKAQKLKVTAGHEPGADLGPVISPESKQRINDLVDSAVKQVKDSSYLRISRDSSV